MYSILGIAGLVTMLVLFGRQCEKTKQAGRDAKAREADLKNREEAGAFSDKKVIKRRSHEDVVDEARVKMRNDPSPENKENYIRAVRGRYRN